MTTHNAENERVKRAYFEYLKEARRYSELSVDSVAKALNRFEVYTKFRPFKAFHIEQAMGFDADTDGTAGNQAFRFIGAGAFTGVDGQLRFAGGLLQGDTNGDGIADIEIKIVGSLLAGDVIL